MKSLALRRVDWAYLLYAWVACVVWIEPLVEKLPIDPEYGQFLFMLLWIPLGLSIVGAVLMAFIYTILERREWPLLVMMAILASMSAVFLIVDEVDQSWYAVGTALLVIFTLRRFWIRRIRASSP
jgi:hypothetical protein